MCIRRSGVDLYIIPWCVCVYRGQESTFTLSRGVYVCTEVRSRSVHYPVVCMCVQRSGVDLYMITWCVCVYRGQESTFTLSRGVYVCTEVRSRPLHYPVVCMCVQRSGVGHQTAEEVQAGGSADQECGGDQGRAKEGDQVGHTAH